MTQTTVSKSLLILLLMLILILAVGAVFVVRRWDEKNRWTRITPEQVESDIRQHVPIGSPRERVAAYLDDGKIPHHYYGEDFYKDTAYYKCEVALLPQTASSGLITSNIQIIFKFDNDKRLATYSVRKVNKGP